MALTGVLAEAGTIPSRSLVEDLFLQLPTDARFHQVTNQKIVPATALDDNSTQISFQLPALDFPNVYFLQDTLLECVVIITKEDGKTLPVKTDKVCLVNNGLASLFSNVSLSINDALISTVGSNYAYKDYLQTLLSYSNDSKAFLQSKGWFMDSPPNYTGIDNNSAYGEKTAMFRRNRNQTTDFKPEGCTLIDKLYHDLSSCNHFIPSQTKVQITLTRNNDKFCLLKLATDTEKWRLKILSCVLYVPVGIMSDRMSSDLMNKWTHQPIQYFYDRLEVKALTMPSNKQEFLSDGLFPQGEHPSRVYVMLVDSDAYLGDYVKSPYNFQRKWTIEVGKKQLNNFYSVVEAENTLLKSSLEELKSQMNYLVQMSREQHSKSASENVEDERPLKKKRAARYKNKSNMQIRNNLDEPIPSTSSQANSTNITQNSASMWQRLFNKHRSVCDNDTVSSEAIESRASSIIEEAIEPTRDYELQGTPKNFWITKCELEINSSPIDQFESNCTEDDALQDFIRLQKTIGQFHNIYSCGLDYKTFMTNSYICGFDLTTCQTSGLAYCINSVRTGHMRLRIRFNESIPRDLTIIILAEFPAHLEISKSGLVKTSFSTK